MNARVHLVSLGCARNDVDSEELLARLEQGGFEVTDDPDAADAVVVNTCGFIDAAKKDSVDTLLAASDLKETGRAKAVVAVGCMAERYGAELAEALPEADAVLGFDAYPDIADRLRWIMAGGHHEAHTPRDRRLLLPLAPADRPGVAGAVVLPGHGADADADDTLAGVPASGPRVLRRRLDNAPMAPLKVASGCDRRCTFCAIPSFRGSYLSRDPGELVAEARWLAERGVKELFLVSENTSSYGKDLRAGQRALENLLTELAGVDGIEWLRVSYLQPAELRPGMIEGMLAVDKVVPYFDLSFQHAAPGVLRRMRRFGDPEAFLGLIDRVRSLAPNAGIRSNVIVGFPGETADDFATLTEFASAARLDALGVFGYSDEEGTEAATLTGKLPEDVVAERVETMALLAEQVCAERAEDRVGERVRVLVEQPDGVGRAAHQGPEVDGTTRLAEPRGHRVGSLVWATVTAADGIDLTASEAS